jgi:glutamate dehydrogenase/leucine dehydrogenase
MVDEYSRLVGVPSPGAFTGKPVHFGGSLGRDKATAQGGVYVLQKILELKEISLQGKTVAIQ